MVYSTLPDHGQILENFKKLIDNSEYFLEITKLNLELAVLIIKDWLRKANRSLSESQWSLLLEMLEKSVLYPLYVKLIFDIISMWPSFHEPDNQFKKCLNIDSTITYLFKLLEKEHGKLLFSRSIIYMSSFKNGISESEIEDILSSQFFSFEIFNVKYSLQFLF